MTLVGSNHLSKSTLVCWLGDIFCKMDIEVSQNIIHSHKRKRCSFVLLSHLASFCLVVGGWWACPTRGWNQGTFLLNFLPDIQWEGGVAALEAGPPGSKDIPKIMQFLHCTLWSSKSDSEVDQGACTWTYKFVLHPRRGSRISVRGAELWTQSFDPRGGVPKPQFCPKIRGVNLDFCQKLHLLPTCISMIQSCSVWKSGVVSNPGIMWSPILLQKDFFLFTRLKRQIHGHLF